jgi:tetratricopeptide (TPR) repeat protein
MSAPGRTLLVLLILGACRDTRPAALGAGGAPTYRTAPLSQIELRTTDGAIALGNLQAQIDGERRLAADRPLTLKQRAGIAELIAMRGQFLGRVADYELAEAQADAMVRDAPSDGLALLARARARSTFHRFGDALRDLDEAERLGFRSRRIESLRAAIFQATGRYDEALAVRQRMAQTRPDIDALGAEAAVHADRGDIAEAERLFTEAPHHYRDVSPFPVAWLYFQQGLMWMREGQFERAREFFEAAHTRLPAYAAAQGHLGEVEAAMGHTTRAIELLRPLAMNSDDPDYAAQLARILGGTEEAQRWRDVAAARYDELIARHPEAFADHAAEFWMSAGGDAKKALTLAQRNLDVRRTRRAYELVLQAALACGEQPAACDAAAHTRAFGHLWPSLSALTARAADSCS